MSVTGDSVLSNAVAAALGNAVTLGAALTVDNPADLTLAGNISGSGTLIKTNTGVLTLDGNNIYSGGTTISQLAGRYHQQCSVGVQPGRRRRVCRRGQR